jgi:5-methylcytosine-specific restriction endonuclease McrA
MNISDDLFIKVCKESKTMAKAAAVLGIHFNTFKRRAIKLGVYKPNQAGVGINKRSPGIDVYEIIEGLHPYYQTYKLKNKLFKEGIKENKCDICDISNWMGKKINCELDHINGDRTDHRIENLRILCPNCHSQTETFRSKNIDKIKSKD